MTIPIERTSLHLPKEIQIRFHVEHYCFRCLTGISGLSEGRYLLLWIYMACLDVCVTPTVREGLKVQFNWISKEVRFGWDSFDGAINSLTASTRRLLLGVRGWAMEDILIFLVGVDWLDVLISFRWFITRSKTYIRFFYSSACFSLVSFQVSSITLSGTLL
jgi:hypothetical protein